MQVAGEAIARPDFNGDGYADLAVGVPGEDVSGVKNAGAVEVIYGTYQGLNGDLPVDDQFWTQNGLERSDIVSEEDDRFGSALAAGDFDGDGYDDLAIGVPYETVNTATRAVREAGTVHVLFGTRFGLTNVGQLALTQESVGVADSVEPFDHFGWALAAADFGRGDRDDLAIGVPGENAGGEIQAGAVNVLYGSPAGPTRGNLLWHQDIGGIPGAAEQFDKFGFSLVAGKLGRSKEADLVVGVPYENVGTAPDVGAVNVIYGSGFGLTRAGAQMWHQGSEGIPGDPEAGDRFGWALTAADFGNGSFEDLVVGVPYEDEDSVDSGAVDALYGASAGLNATHAQLWTQGTPGIRGDPEDGDHFGFALAAANFGVAPVDPRAELVVGVPGEDKENLLEDDPNAGAINLLFGSSSGLTGVNSQWFDQDSSGIDGSIEGETEPEDQFGATLITADFGRGAVNDLAIGVPGEGREPSILTCGICRNLDYVGAVDVLYGDGRGYLRYSDDQFWWQASDSIHDSAEDYDHFGTSLAE
jgi:hypothetical protein